MKITVIILVKDEAIHIRRAISSVRAFANHILVVDSGSTDRTVEIAEELGAEVRFHAWLNYSTQMNWALENVPSDAEWVLRLDADEFVTEPLSQEIMVRLPKVGDEIEGIYVDRFMRFLGAPVRFGGVFPVQMLRLVRNRMGKCEDRWMDEYLIVKGPTMRFRGAIVDCNLKSLTWWVAKHNSYASREALDLLNLELGFLPSQDVQDEGCGGRFAFRRALKENVYLRLPGGIRAAIYFLYRFVFRLGFLDSKGGVVFHVLQGFWYRYLVDIKVREVKRYMEEHDADIVQAARVVLEIDLSGLRSN